MKIGINLLFLIPNKVGGSETYTRGLISALEKYDKHNEYLLFCNHENYDSFKNSKFKKIKLPVKSQYKIYRLLFEQILMWIYVKKHNIQILYSPGYISPFYSGCISIVNVFDLNWYYHKEDFGLIERLMWKFLVSGSVKFSQKVTTSSYASKNSLVRILNVTKPIKVIYPGLPKLSTNKKITLKLPNKYFMALTSLHPHKNVMGLLKIFLSFSEYNKDVNLVISGIDGKDKENVIKFIKNHNLQNTVNLLGYVSNTQLPILYKNSIALIITSKYEGFGIPAIEAFSLGVPVVSSDSFSLKEVIADGGSLQKYWDYKSFIEEMLKLSSNNQYRKKMAQRSRLRAKYFSWKTTAETFIKFIN